MKVIHVNSVELYEKGNNKTRKQNGQNQKTRSKPLGEPAHLYHSKNQCCQVLTIQQNLWPQFQLLKTSVVGFLTFFCRQPLVMLPTLFLL